jgi:Uma2 family endonuclease
MALAEFPRHRFTVEEYHRMGETGLLQPDLRVELIEGEVIDMAPIGPDHVGTVNYLNAVLAGSLAGRAVVQVQGPARLSDITEPEPDLLVLRPRDDFYRSRHAEPRDIILAIEVAKTSLRFDRDVKLPLYGRAGVPETWIVDIAGHVITVATGPGGDGYEHVRTATPGESLAVLGVDLDVAQVLGLGI